MLERLLATPVSKVSALLLAAVLIAAVGAPWFSPYDATDLASFDIADANLPPAWYEGGSEAHLLGTDDQGRDLFSAILSGTRLSLAIGVTAALLSLVLGVTAGLVAGYAGGVLDTVLMRLCDVMLAFPTLLAALLVDGILRTVLGEGAGEGTLYAVLLIAMTVTGWVPYARTVRRLRVRGEALGRLGNDDSSSARAPERHGAGLRAGDLESEFRRDDRGDAFLPRGRRAAHDAVARDPHSDRQRLSLFGRMVDRALPERGARRDGLLRQFPG